jgi:hypothetical protein
VLHPLRMLKILVFDRLWMIWNLLHFIYYITLNSILQVSCLESCSHITFKCCCHVFCVCPFIVIIDVLMMHWLGCARGIDVGLPLTCQYSRSYMDTVIENPFCLSSRMDRYYAFRYYLLLLSS